MSSEIFFLILHSENNKKRKTSQKETDWKLTKTENFRIRGVSKVSQNRQDY